MHHHVKLTKPNICLLPCLFRYILHTLIMLDCVDPDRYSLLQVSRVFHPNFTAKWRRYFYIFPLDNGDQDQIEGGILTSVDDNDDQLKAETQYEEDDMLSVVCNANDDPNSEIKPRSFTVSKVNELLRHLEGKCLSYKMFARDTKASRST